MDPELSGMFIVEALDHLGTIETSVLALEYEDRGVLRTVDGDGPVDVVTARISGALATSLGASP